MTNISQGEADVIGETLCYLSEIFILHNLIEPFSRLKLIADCFQFTEGQ